MEDYYNIYPHHNVNSKKYKEDIIQKVLSKSNNSFLNKKNSNEISDLNISLYSNISTKSQKNAKKPENKKFTFHYQNNFYIKDYFVFNYKGNLTTRDFENKTKQIRKYPLYLKLTMFLDKSYEIERKREFSLIKVTIDQLKYRAYKLYLKENYYQSLQFYIKAYGLLKWLKLKNQNNISYAFMTQNQKPILDSDITLNTTINNYGAINYDEPQCSFSFVISDILLAMSYACINLNYYDVAVDCLNECLSYDKQNHCALFRRSQAIYYNKQSKIHDIKNALKDIKSAIEITKESCTCNKDYNKYQCICGKVPNIYIEHYNEVKKLYENLQKENNEKIVKLVKECMYKYKNINKSRWLSYDSEDNYQMQEIQSKVLLIMKENYKLLIQSEQEKEIKDSTRNINEEFDYFMSRYDEFFFYYNLNTNDILLNCKDISFINYMKHFKNNKVDSVFQESKFNLEFIKEAIRKVEKNQEKIKILESKLNLHYLNDHSYKLYLNFPAPLHMSFYLSLILLFFSMFFMCSQYYLILRPPNKSF